MRDSLFAPASASTQAVPIHFVRVAVERGLDERGPRGERGERGGRGRGGHDGLTYATETAVPIGSRVEVPLGRGDTSTGGIVIATGGSELLDGFDPRRVKPILRQTGQALPPSLVELARWMSGYYVCPLGMVLATMMPAAVKKAIGQRTHTLIDFAQEPLARARGSSFELPESPDSPENGASRASERSVEPSDVSSPDQPALSPSAKKAWALLQELSRTELPMAADALAVRLGLPTVGPLNRLVKAGLLVKVQREEVHASRQVWEAVNPASSTAEARALPTLSPDQHTAVEGIGAALAEGGSFSVHLLRGVTGSGKTEVYLRLIARVLAAGKRAIVLVPEISLTPQTAGRFVERFAAVTGSPTNIAVLHSGLTAAQRHSQWAAISSGTAQVVVGARSAIFAPITDLGLIVVDEEHATDYKQDQLPRYHGRDVAIVRARLEACPVLLGSATPSLESWANAVPAPHEQRPKYHLWELPTRVGTGTGGRMPAVRIVDMNAERRIMLDTPGPQKSHFLDQIGPTLARALRDTLDDRGGGGQAMLLLNRRGYGCYLSCPSPSCGFILRCTDCDASLVHHKVAPGRELRAGELVRCHHCQAQSLLPTACPTCHRPLRTLGLGTQGVEEELRRKFPLLDKDDALLRVDGDTMSNAVDYFHVLSRFAKGEVRVLLGTQMIAKGHDFPNVRLVGVINADTALNLPDFRASERTFQLVSQVAGRAGRGEHKGLVIVQTYSPEAVPIRHAAKHDYVGFATEELEIRRAAGLPPIGRMARIVVRHEEFDKAMAAAQKITDFLRAHVAMLPLTREKGGGIDIQGPSPCVLSRLASYFRVGIEIIANGTNARMTLQSLLGSARSAGLVKSDSRTAVDVDPIALM